MNINFYTKNFEMGNEVKEYVEDKLNKFVKFSKDNISADVKFERSKFQNNKDVFSCRVVLLIDGKDFNAEKTGSNAFEAMDSVEDAIESMVLKNKDQKISNKKSGKLDSIVDIDDLIIE